MGRVSRIIWVGQCSHGVIMRGKWEDQSQTRRCEDRSEIDVFEDGGRGHKPRNTGGLEKLEKARQ